jgi:hypothetical protein
MQLIDKLPYGFLAVSITYMILAAVGFIDFEATRGYFDLAVIVSSFVIGYKLTEEYVIRFDTNKIIGIGLGLGTAVGIALFLLNAIMATEFKIGGGGLKIDFPKIIIGASVIAIEIVYVSVSLGAGSLLATLLRKEKEEREGLA